MSAIECLQPSSITTPKIRIQSASPIPFKASKIQLFKGVSEEENLSVRRRGHSVPSLESFKKRTAAAAGLTETKSGSEENHLRKMSSSPKSKSQSQSPSCKTSSASPPPTKRPKASAKDVDWSEVTDPEERRRIQNRIAQRKFREKAREQKEKAERDSRNQEHAGNCYRIPEAIDIDTELELSGLPWGSVSLSHVLARGHEAESRRSSGKGTHLDGSLSSGHYSLSYGPGFQQTASYDSSGADDMYFEDNPFIYDPSILRQAFPSIS